MHVFFVYKIFFVACFVKSSPEVSFRINLILRKTLRTQSSCYLGSRNKYETEAVITAPQHSVQLDVPLFVQNLSGKYYAKHTVIGVKRRNVWRGEQDGSVSRCGSRAGFCEH
jgi:hypothetical protein